MKAVTPPCDGEGWNGLRFLEKISLEKKTVRQFQEPGTLLLSDAPGDEAHRGLESPEWRNERSNQWM